MYEVSEDLEHRLDVIGLEDLNLEALLGCLKQLLSVRQTLNLLSDVGVASAEGKLLHRCLWVNQPSLEQLHHVLITVASIEAEGAACLDKHLWVVHNVL